MVSLAIHGIRIIIWQIVRLYLQFLFKFVYKFSFFLSILLFRRNHIRTNTILSIFNNFIPIRCFFHLIISGLLICLVCNFPYWWRWSFCNLFLNFLNCLYFLLLFYFFFWFWCYLLCYFFYILLWISFLILFLIHWGDFG